MKKLLLIVGIFLIFISKVNASYVLMDQKSGTVYSGSAMHEKRLIASITKVMTAYIVINNVNDLDELVTVGDEIDSAHGSSIYLTKGETLRVRDLLYGMMLRSGNDAAIVLANYTAGSVENFVSLMNKEANNLNMNDTIFYNPTGLDDDVKGNISSAYDMALITSRAMQNDTFKKIFKTKHYKCKSNLKSFDWYNKNKALMMERFITGGKTGFTKKARRTLITTASKNNIDLVLVTLNYSDDFNFHVNTYKNFYSSHQSYLILNKNNLPIKDKYYGKYNCTYYMKDNYYIIDNKKNLKNYNIDFLIYKNLEHQNNIHIGKAIVYKNSKAFDEQPIYLRCKSERYY